jgi:homoserine kinase
VTFSRAEAFAPATVANLGIGFDILGLAVQGAGDVVVAERATQGGVFIRAIEGDNGRLPRDATKNVASIAAMAVLELAGVDAHIALTVKKGLPLASGLGSSAASSVAAAVAVNALLGSPLSREVLLKACLEGEAAVSGYHADNVAPALFGGITLTVGTEAENILRLPVPKGVYLALVTPDVAVPTAKARAVLPASVPLKQMVQQTGGVALLIDAIYRGDVRAMARAMQSDAVVEPARAHLMPHLSDLRAVAQEAGALCLVISGAGPTLMAVCDNADVAERVAHAMRDAYTRFSFASQARHAQILEEGAHILRLD